MLKIEQEVSDLASSSAGAVDLITNKRTITTNVLVEDGGIIVLGGLIRDEVLDNEQRVPILGSIPLIGQLFKVRHTQKIKTNLMVFIRPKILRDGVQTAFETNSKYNYMREEQLRMHDGKVPLLPLEKGPSLPELAPASATPAAAPETYIDATQGAQTKPLPGSAPPAAVETPTPTPDEKPPAETVPPPSERGGR